MITETIYKKRDNVNSIELRENGSAVDISGTTRMILQIGDTKVDSQYDTGVFDWSTNGASGQLDLTLGLLQKIINMRESTYLARLVLYDANYTNGLEWAEFRARIVD